MHRPLPSSGPEEQRCSHKGQRRGLQLMQTLFPCSFLLSFKKKLKVPSFQFIVKDSVEENMVKIQKQKQDLVEKAFGSADRKISRIDDIRALMEL